MNGRIEPREDDERKKKLDDEHNFHDHVDGIRIEQRKIR